MEINTLTDLSTSTSYTCLVFDTSNYTEFTFADEYFSDWEVFDYSKTLSDIDDLSRSLPKVDYIPRSPEATERHLSTSEESMDPGYVSSKMSSSSGSNKSTQEWIEDPNDVLGIEYYEPSLQMPDGFPTNVLSFNDFMEGISATSELHDRSKSCKHNTSAVLHCQTCNDFLCIRCKVNHYITHNVKVTDGAMQSLAESKDQCQQKLDETRRHLAEIHQYQKDVTHKRRLVREQLRHQRAALYEKIESEFEKLNTQVELVWSQEIMMTNTKIQTLFHLIEDEQKHLEEIEKLLKVCHDDETFSERKQTVQVHKKHSCNSLAQSHNDALGMDDLTLAFDLDLTSRSSFHRQYFILNQDGDSNNCHLGQFSTGNISGTNLKTCLVSRGRTKSSFKTRGRQGMSHMASGLSVTPEGNLIVTDLGRDVAAVYDKDGKRRVTLNILPQDEPSATEQMDNGTFLVAFKDGLKLLSESGHLLRRIETSIDSPRGIAYSPTGTIVVTNQEPMGSLIHILSSRDFRCIHTIIGGTRAPLFTQAWYVATDDSTNIIISDSAEHTVKILSPHGMLMYEFGGRGCKPGQFFFPAGVCVDAYGHILVADMGNNRIQMFSKTGEFLAVILNSEDDLHAPIDLAVDSDLDLIILQGNGEVKVIQYIF